MQTNLQSKAERWMAPAFILILGLAIQVNGADRKLFFIKDPVKTNSFTVERTVEPAVTNSFETKVLVVNRFDQTFTIEHEGRLHLLRVDDGTELYNAKGKKTTLDWVTAGQTISVKAQQRPSGRLDLLAASILPSRQQAQAAGKKKTVTPAPEPVVFPSEDARPKLTEETPLPTDAVVPAPTDEVAPQPETPAPQPESAPEPAPQNDSEPK